MKILLATGIYPPDAGGPATYTRALARALASQGHAVQVVAYGDGDGLDEADGYPVQRIGRNRNVFARYWNFFVAVFARTKECDLVYLQGPVSEGLPGMLAAKFAGKPTVMKIVGDYAWEVYANNGGTELLDAFLTYPHAGKVGWIAMIERWTAKCAKKIIVPSEYLKTVVMKWGVATDRITVIPNAVEPLPVGRSREDARSAFDVAAHRVMFASVRSVPWKSVDFLIDLLSELPADIVFAIAGDGPSLAQWKKHAESRGVSSRVRFLGRLDRATLSDWYRAADLFVLPSGYEGFPFVIPEAASVGLPSFVSDKGGNPETVKFCGSELVRVLPYRDVVAWRDALSTEWPLRHAEQESPALKFETLFSATLNVLTSV